MELKQTNGTTPKKNGKESIVRKVLSIDPKLRTAKQWLMLSKGTLTLTAISINI